MIESEHAAPIVAVGPRMPGWGSWDWVGADMATELSNYFRVEAYGPHESVSCDIRLVIKHLQLAPQRDNTKRTATVFCPIDLYDSPAEIDADAPALRACSRIVIHCERLRRYLEPYAPVEYMDHHVKFVVPIRKRLRKSGFVLWVGVHSNLPALVHWINEHPLPLSLHVLTNFGPAQPVPNSVELGFRAPQAVRIENWTRERHLQLLGEAQAAIDLKDGSFRSMHKPPAKAIDFIASGVPLAMNPESSAVEHLSRLGFDVASPLDAERWLSAEYRKETCEFGQALREMLSRPRIGRRFRKIIAEVLAELR